MAVIILDTKNLHSFSIHYDIECIICSLYVRKE
jgi:hypothetical protein